MTLRMVAADSPSCPCFATERELTGSPVRM